MKEGITVALFTLCHNSCFQKQLPPLQKKTWGFTAAVRTADTVLQLLVPEPCQVLEVCTSALGTWGPWRSISVDPKGFRVPSKEK